MAALVWFTTGVALWHFTVFLPDRFWAGIVGALLGAATGAMITGAIAQAARGWGIGETDMVTVLAAVPGTALGLAVVYWLGVRHDADVVSEPV
jgi:hypothetical protein